MLTLTRFALVVPIAWLVYHAAPLHWVVLLIGVALATDYFDGKVARWTGTVSDWGKVLDPLADKFAAAAITLALVLRPTDPTLPVWFVAMVIARDAVIAAGGVVQTRRLGHVLMALWSGKVAVNLLALTIVAVLLRLPDLVISALVAVTSIALLYSLGQYLHRFAIVMRHGTDVRLNDRDRVVRERPHP